ncbi:MAG: PAS domain S-box protein [Deltaproteobacteria bacterium]|nr:PAS domain S-box protein [Deltaproteobacteria bacterium]
MEYMLANTDPQNVFFRCVEDCSEAIMVTDTKGILLYVNPAWCQIYGFTKKEAVGQTPKILHSGYQPSEFYRQMWQTILNPKLGSWKGDIVNKSKNGALTPVLLTITPVRDPNGQIVGHMGIALDMSAQKQLESKVLQQDRLASIGVLSSGLAHEVGTPLGVVRGRAEFLMMQPEVAKSPVLGIGLQTIVTQIDRISRLISSLLRFSRATDDVHNQDIEFLAVIDEVENLIGQNLKASSIELKLEIPKGLKIHADFNRLQQVFLNLMVNAVHAIQKAQKDGSGREHAIVIHAERKGEASDSSVVITVKDSGCGIAPGNLRKIFQPFFTTKDVGEGTGLGLAIVSKLVHEMRGEIMVESVLGEGANFTLFLRSR